MSSPTWACCRHSASAARRPCCTCRPTTWTPSGSARSQAALRCDSHWPRPSGASATGRSPTRSAIAGGSPSTFATSPASSTSGPWPRCSPGSPALWVTGSALPVTLDRSAERDRDLLQQVERVLHARLHPRVDVGIAPLPGGVLHQHRQERAAVALGQGEGVQGRVLLGVWDALVD